MIFEDDEKDNNEFDASINSDDTEGISWDDLIDESSDYENQEIELGLGQEIDNIQSMELTDGLEGIPEEKHDNNEIIERDLDNFADLDMLEDQNDGPVIEETNEIKPADDIFLNGTENGNQEENNYTQQEMENVGENQEYQESQGIQQYQGAENVGEYQMAQDELDSSDENAINLEGFNQIQENPSVVQSDDSDIIGLASLNISNEEEDSISGFDAEPSAPKSADRSNKGPIISGFILALLLVVAIVGGLSFILLKNGGSVTSIFNTQKNNQGTEDISMDTDFSDMGDMNTPQDMDMLPQDSNTVPAQNENNISNQAPAPQEKQETNKAKPKEEKVVVKVTPTGRANPFSPMGNISQAGYTVPALNNLAPPSDLNEDEELGKLVDIVCTGILYDNVKPSAIITVGGVDYFVQKGDRVDKFIVSAITPTSVVIRNGTNSYVATIGQEFDIGGTTPGKMNYVYNGKSKPVTRQYLSPQEIEVKVK